MKKYIMASILIGTIVLYGGYSLIFSSDNSKDTANSPSSKEIAGIYKYSNTNNQDNKLIADEGSKLRNNENSQGIIDNTEGTFTSKDSNNNENSLNNNIETNEKNSKDNSEFKDESILSKDIETNNVIIVKQDNGMKTDQEKLEEVKQAVLANDILGDKAIPDFDTDIVTADNDTNSDTNSDTEMNGRGPVIETLSTRTSSVVRPDKRLSLIEKIFIHRVEAGDNLWEIASKYNIDIDTLIGANDITNINTIQIGDEIKILPVKGILYKVNPGESLWTIARQFSISIDVIAEANALVNVDLVKPGMSLVLPDAKPEVGYKDRIGKNFISPIKGRISSYYGPRWGKTHEGIDWAVNTGTEVRAARSGKVIYSEWASGYGYTVVIEHQKGVRTLYAHNFNVLVHGGQWVERGQVISLSGNTGRSTGPHLHFEIQINGKPVNPLNYIR